jgi:NAD(P)-dependent dehydrogenase (short-subunit alcohol dehydrogenase family)
VSNAGIQKYGDVVATEESLWDEVFAVNLKSCYLVAKHVIPFMLKRGGGAIVAVGSVQSISAVSNSAAYVAAKHGLLGLVRSIALDFAARKIRANCVLPGAIDTPMLRWAASLSPNPDAVIATCDRMHALGRIGKSEEVAQAIAFLASDDASFITGAALLVDGGMMVPAGGMGFSEGGTGSAK